MATSNGKAQAAPASRAPGNAKPGTNGASQAAMIRNRFFYIYYRKLTLILILALGVSAFSLGSAVFFALRKTPPVYIPVTVDGRVIPNYKLSEPSNADPSMMDAEVKQWALEAARKTFSFDYINYREQIGSAQSYFTVRGWREFLSSFEASQNLNTVMAQKMIVNFIPLQPPKILGQQVRDGRYSWALEFPAKIKYTVHDASGKAGFYQKGKIQAILTRVSMVDSPKGIGVDQLIFVEDGK